MAELEKLHIKLGIGGTYWAKRPQYRVVFNDQLILDSEIRSDSGSVDYIEFDCEYVTDCATLQIQLVNKENSDVVKDDPNKITDFVIVKDLLLHIKSVEIDDIDLGHLTYSLSEYRINNPVEYNGEIVRVLKNCTDLGWNGSWQISWENPFYIWLLENL